MRNSAGVLANDISAGSTAPVAGSAAPGPGGTLDDQLCFALYAATNAVTRAYRPLLAQIGLTYPQYLVMLAMWDERRSTSGRIARRLGLAANALTPLLERLETNGLLCRRRDEGDRRRVHVELTPEGEALEGEIVDAQRAVACRLGMSEQGIAALRAELQGLVRRMEAEGEASA